MSAEPKSTQQRRPPSSVPIRPDDLLHFRVARLLLLLDVAHEQDGAMLIDVERLGFYDFFAANPFLVFTDEGEEHLDMLLAGFETKNLSYQSSAQRFTNRRARLQHDLAFLVAHGTANVAASQGKVTYEITESGRELASRIRSLYARSYRRSARAIVKHLGRLSDAKLNESAKRWLRAESFLIDILDDAEIP